MHVTFVTLWLQVVQPLANAHETKCTPHVKRESDVAQSYTSSEYGEGEHALVDIKRDPRHCPQRVVLLEALSYPTPEVAACTQVLCSTELPGACNMAWYVQRDESSAKRLVRLSADCRPITPWAQGTNGFTFILDL